MPTFLVTFFFLHELHTNSPRIDLKVCKGMCLMSLFFNAEALRELHFYHCLHRRYITLSFPKPCS